jgi:hypothetical protein
MTSLRQTSLFTEDTSTSSAVDSHAKPFQQQAQEKAQKIPDTFGRKCSVLYERFAPDGSWERTFLDLLIGTGDWFSTRCALTWKMKASKSSRLFCQLQVSTRHIKETEFFLLPTQRVKGHGNSHQRIAQGRMDDLTTLAKMGLLPTPATRDYKGASSIEALKKRGRYKRIADNLADQFPQHGKSSQLNPRFVAEMMGFPLNWTELPFLNGETNPSKDTVMQ